MRHPSAFPILIICLLLQLVSRAQIPILNRTFSFGGTTQQYVTQLTADGKTVSLSDSFSIEKKKGKEAVKAFLYKNVKTTLLKVFTQQAARPAIEDFADRYASLAAINIFDLVTNTKIREKQLDNYRLIEYWTGEQFTYYISSPNLNTAATNLLIPQNTGWQWSKEARHHPLLKNKLIEIVKFIDSNKVVAIPPIRIKGIPVGHLLLLNTEPDTLQIPLTKEQAAPYKGTRLSFNATDTLYAFVLDKEAEVSSSVAPAQKPEPKPATAKENKELTLVPAQKIKCKDGLEFELSALTTKTGTLDSFQLELNTPLKKNRKTLVADAGEVTFKRETKTLFGDSCNSKAQDSSLSIFYVKLTEKLTAKEKEQKAAADKEKNDKFVDSLKKIFDERLAALGSEKEYAVLLESRKSIPLYTSASKVKCWDAQIQRKEVADGTKMLEVDSVVIRISNNTIYQLDIVGQVDKTPIQTLSNNQYGLSLRNLIDGSQSLFFTINGKEYYFCYRDLFFARPTKDGVISYELRDGEYHFYPDSLKLKSRLLDQKRLLDYVSASAFVDLLAFNSENANKNLLTEIYFNYHINPYNIRRGFGIFKNAYLPVSFGVNLFKEGEGMETFRKKNIVRIDSTVTPRDTTTANQYYFKNLDLLRNSFLQIRPMINIAAWDAKGIRTLFELNGGYLLMGSNARLNDPSKGEDSLYTKAIYSYSWAAETRIRLNPRPRYGFDLHVLYSFGLRPFNTDFKSVTGEYRVRELGKANMLNENKDDFILGELNFFFNPRAQKSDTDKGGLYFKLNWYKSMHYNDGHFMFLVGYSTDIKNFFR